MHPGRLATVDPQGQRRINMRWSYCVNYLLDTLELMPPDPHTEKNIAKMFIFGAIGGGWPKVRAQRTKGSRDGTGTRSSGEASRVHMMGVGLGSALPAVLGVFSLEILLQPVNYYYFHLQPGPRTQAMTRVARRISSNRELVSCETRKS